MKYPEFSTVNYADLAEEVLKNWQKEQIFEKSISEREGAKTFTFYEGPPSANGVPGIHHVMARTIKDIFCRYKTLKGFQVKRKGGWDTHGLPVELQVEKEISEELGEKFTKEDIGKKVSVDEYNKRCREAVLRFTDIWKNMTDQMGYWVDMDDPYITYKNEYIESVWHLLKELHKKGYLYKGYTIQPYSPAAGTGLSSHELNQPGCYKDVTDTSLTAQFKVVKNSKSEFLFEQDKPDVYVLAWTTTPWTLPSNSALAVGKGIKYALVETFNPYTHLPVRVLAAADRLGAYFNEKGKDQTEFNAKVIPWKVVGTYTGAELDGVSYEQLMPYVKPETEAFRVIIGDFVTTEDGTGIVHLAPTFGADDFRVAQTHGIPSIVVFDEAGKPLPLVNKQGQFVEEVNDFALEYVKEDYLNEAEKEAERKKQDRDKYLSVDERIAIKLKTENKAFNVQRYEHSYPHCWRTDKPVLYYPLDSWFIRTTAVKEKLVELNKTINWKPESTGVGRFGNWLENLVDWNLSRSRYWGTPLPIWVSENDELCIGSIEELLKAIEHANASTVLSQDLKDKNTAFVEAVARGEADLHRPYVDEIYLLSAEGEIMYREPDLIDVWFDSGSMPYAQHHYPFKDSSFNNDYPADFISEGVDQTRGWFFTLHAIAGLLFDSVAFKNVVSTGLVLDKNGNKMSKRLGNAIDPFSTLGTYGADPTRWYMISNAQPWDNLKFDLDGITEVRNKFFGTLTNTYNFFALYANLDGFNPEENFDFSGATGIDKWVLSKLQSLVVQVDADFEDYEPTKATRAIQSFVSDHLSNWYVRLGRRRFWNTMPGQEADKAYAYHTLHKCLSTLSVLMSPVAPFYADWLYKNLGGAKESVHLADFPVANNAIINEELETSMGYAQNIASMVHSLRKGNKIKVRQPLSKILIPIINEESRQQITSVEDLIKNEVNIKEIQYLDDESGVLSKKVKPNFKALGPKFGKNVKDAVAAINALDADQIKAAEAGQEIKTPVGAITIDDLLVETEDLPGFLTAKMGSLTVALDTTISQELKEEGIARDFVNKIQNFRKDNGFEVTNRIAIALLDNNAEISSAISNNKDYICQEVQADSLDLVSELQNANEIEFEEEILSVTINVIL